MSMKKKRKRIRMILTCCGILLAFYYLLPALGMGMETAKADAYLSVGLLHLAFPLYLYVSSIVLGLKQGFCSIYAVAAGLLFLPTMLVYFSSSMWPAALIYAAIALAGNLMGWGVQSVLKKMKESAEN